LILFTQNIQAPAGKGILYTLVRETPSQKQRWYEQHAIIPSGSRFLVVWLKTPHVITGAPTPALARMLAGLCWDVAAPTIPPAPPTPSWPSGSAR
jgi:hypothetical protein